VPGQQGAWWARSWALGDRGRRGLLASRVGEALWRCRRSGVSGRIVSVLGFCLCYFFYFFAGRGRRSVSRGLLASLRAPLSVVGDSF